MRATRAYLATLGTTGILVASLLLLFTVVGGFFAFDAWPGRGGASESDTVVLSDETAKQPAAGARPEADEAEPAAGTVRERRRTSRSRDRRRSRKKEESDTLGRSEPVDRPGDPGPRDGTPPKPITPGIGAPAEVRPSLPTSPADDVADTTRDAGDTAGGAVGGASPTLGETVTETGRALSEIVRGLPGAVRRLTPDGASAEPAPDPAPALTGLSAP